MGMIRLIVLLIVISNYKSSFSFVSKLALPENEPGTAHQAPERGHRRSIKSISGLGGC